MYLHLQLIYGINSRGPRLLWVCQGLSPLASTSSRFKTACLYPMFRSLLTLTCLTAISLQAEPLKVASLHPLIADLARQVGGDQI